MYQILRGLEYLHSKNVIHRDLKPRNILINGNCDLKLADFGLARLYTKNDDSKIAAMTEYVTTRWYRAPEILVGWNKYSAAIDMWAAGTILAELISRKPLFPGTDSLHQLQIIMDGIGRPPESFITRCRKPVFRQLIRDSDTFPVNKSLSDCYSYATPASVDLLIQLLKFIPEKRLTASQAVNHPFLDQYRR